MKPDRKSARDFVKSINTRSDLEQYLDMLNLTDGEHEIAMLLFGKGYSRTRIAIETGYSRDQIKRKIARIYDRML